MKVPTLNVPPMKNPMTGMTRPSLQGMSFRGIKPWHHASRESWDSSSVQCGTDNPPSADENRLYTPEDVEPPDHPRPTLEYDIPEGFRMAPDKPESEIKSVYSLDNEAGPNPFDESVMQFSEPNLEGMILNYIRTSDYPLTHRFRIFH